MKIAIYGDSHVAGQIDKGLNPEPSWVDIFSQDFRDVRNFGRGGSSVYYSYMNFLNTHMDYDKVIFFATFPSRVFIGNTNISENYRHIPGPDALNIMLNRGRHTKEELLTLQAARDYFLYLQNLPQDKIYRDLMIKDLKSVRPDVIFFDLCYFYDNKMDDLSYFGVNTREIFSHLFDKRHMHFCYEKNVALAKLLKNNVLNNTNIIDYEVLKRAIPSKKAEEYFISFDAVKDLRTSMQQEKL